MCFSHGKKSDAFSTGAVLRFGCGGARVTRETFLLVSFKFLLSLLRRAFEWLLVFIFFFFDLLFRFSHVFWHVIIGWRLTRRAPFLAPFRTRSTALSGHFQSSCTADFDRFFSSCFTITHSTFQQFQAYSRAISVQFQFSFKAKWSNYPPLDVGDSSVVSVQFLTNYKTN